MPKQNAAPVRCPWSLKGNELYVKYHDTEWGVPAWDDQTQFEFLILEGAQAGLSWSTILNKREGYRAAFAGFDAERMARFGKRDVTRLMKDAAIVRNRLKIESAISNARAYLEFQEASGGFARHLWTFVGGKPVQNRFTEQKQVPATSAESD
ncbi:MAG: DNA-3-methyladenine glycosylase I, partial [Steroidobacter sp.]